jgi:hypothetical protein
MGSPMWKRSAGSTSPSAGVAEVDGAEAAADGRTLIRYFVASIDDTLATRLHRREE